MKESILQQKSAAGPGLVVCHCLLAGHEGDREQNIRTISAVTLNRGVTGRTVTVSARLSTLCLYFIVNVFSCGIVP